MPIDFYVDIIAINKCHLYDLQLNAFWLKIMWIPYLIQFINIIWYWFYHLTAVSNLNLLLLYSNRNIINKWLLYFNLTKEMVQKGLNPIFKIQEQLYLIWQVDNIKGPNMLLFSRCTDSQAYWQLRTQDYSRFNKFLYFIFGLLYSCIGHQCSN